jgi:hypothetical protein
MESGDRHIGKETIMRKALFVISLAALVTAGTIVNADGPVLDRLFNYYTDSTFSVACGYVDMNCGTTSSGGYTTSWRYAEFYRCDDGEQTFSSCQEWNGTNWANVACPDPTVTALMRIHIPIGR